MVMHLQLFFTLVNSDNLREKISLTLLWWLANPLFMGFLFNVNINDMANGHTATLFLNGQIVASYKQIEQ